MYPRVILRGTLYKKSQQKRRTSPCNYKERYFVLNTQDLTYSEQRPGKKPTQKGCIELSRIKCVEIVRSDLPIPCDYKYPFQVVYDTYYLYVFAPDNDCRLKWVRALKEETKCNNLSLNYHPDFWGEGRWRCCNMTEKLAPGCSEYYPSGCASKKPLPPTPELQRYSSSDEQIVVALRNFTPQEKTDIPLQKGEQYVLIDSSQPNWWTVRNKEGYVGTVPCTYCTYVLEDNIEKFEWYNKAITRVKAEELLMNVNKEGAFMVRDSREPGVYTVSVFTKAAGSNGEKFPRVKHYKIRQTEDEANKYYLAEKYLFNTIPELIHYHQHNAAGLITRLRHCVSENWKNSQRIEDLASEKWQLDMKELTLVKEVGRGQFGLVFEGLWNDKQVAVKTIREEAMSEEDFKEEAIVMMKLSHAKLVQLHGVCTQHSPMYLVFEFVENGCLAEFLRTTNDLPENTFLRMCEDVSEAMAYLEGSNFIHRDLSARNCLVSKDLVVKVADFGMTRFVPDDKYTSYTAMFAMKWASPEVISYGKFSSKSDVWSFGVLMWEVYSRGRIPYERRTNAEVLEFINAGQRLQKPKICPETVFDLMQWCWKEKPEDRPTFALLFHELALLDDLCTFKA